MRCFCQTWQSLKACHLTFPNALLDLWFNRADKLLALETITIGNRLPHHHYTLEGVPRPPRRPSTPPHAARERCPLLTSGGASLDFACAPVGPPGGAADLCADDTWVRYYTRYVSAMPSASSLFYLTILRLNVLPSLFFWLSSVRSTARMIFLQAAYHGRRVPDARRSL